MRRAVETDAAPEPDLVAVRQEGTHIEVARARGTAQPPARRCLVERDVAVGDGQPAGDDTVAAKAFEEVEFEIQSAGLASGEVDSVGIEARVDAVPTPFDTAHGHALVGKGVVERAL